MAKTPLNENLKYVIGGVGLIITIASVYGSVVLAVGKVANTAEQNTKDIAAHYEDGCKPSVMVRQDVRALQVEVVANQKQLDRIEATQADILKILRNM